MAMYNYQLHNFTLVEQLYNTVKPIRGTDIVPLGDRRRQHERIIKISPTCYALSDVGRFNDETVSKYAVVWRRNADGTDTVEFRNGNGDWPHNGRYSFLQRCMPYNLRFVIDAGKQFIRQDIERYYLPKDSDKEVAFTSGVRKADGRGSEWTLSSKPHPHPVTRVRVNKELKAEYKTYINDYLHWAWDMTPLIEGTMTQGSNRIASHAAQVMFHSRPTVANEQGDNGFRCMLKDEQHPQRTEMLHAFLVDLAASFNNMYWGYNNFSVSNTALTSNPKLFRTKFNTWINAMGDFNETFVEYVEVN